MPDLLVSVIVPVYNVAPYAREALDSVVGQTYRNLDVVVVDDGSTDGSGDICDEYLRDPRVRVIHQQNRGLSAARNAGLDHVHGDVIAFLDSDDSFHPHMLATMVDELARSGADVVVCDFDWDLKGSRLERGSFDSAGALREMAAGRMELAVWNKVYRRELWDGIRFPEGHNCEGTRTTYRLLERAARVEVLPDRLMFHRTRPDSIVQEMSKEFSVDFFLASEEYEGYVASLVPSVLSEEELSRFLGRRLGEKVAHWRNVWRSDPCLAEELRRKVVRQVPDTRAWGPRSRAKWWLLGRCPRALLAVLDLRDGRRVAPALQVKARRG